MGNTINWGIFKRHFWENYSGISTLKRRLSGPGQHDRFALPGGS